MSLNCFVHLALEEVGLAERLTNGVQELDALLLEEVAFLGEGGLDGLGRGGDGGAGAVALRVDQVGLVRQSIIGKKMMSSGFFSWCT